MRSRGIEDPRDRFRTQGGKITDTGQDRGESLGMEAPTRRGSGRIHPDMAGFADDFHRKTGSAQARLQGGLITDHQHIGNARHSAAVCPAPSSRPAGAAVDRVRPSRDLACSSRFQRNHRRRRGAGHHPESVSTWHASDELLSTDDPLRSARGSFRSMLPRSRKV